MSGIEFSELGTRIGGRVSAAGDDGYEDDRLPWALVADQRPAAVVFPTDAEEVRAIVNFAREAGLRIAAQGTGHGAPPIADLGGAILVKTTEMTGVEIDEEAGRARVLAGTLSGDVMNAAAGCGKAALCGSSPDVGMVGYTVGGGIGWLGRKHGIQANALTAVELVTADGELVRADGENEADLFWALRGGGGSFGVITAIEFDLVPVAEAHAGMLAWPWERSEEVLKAWAEWAPGAPDEITTSARILQFPPIPEIPDFLRGRNLVMIDGAHCGSAEDAEEELRPFRELGPELDMWGTMPTPGLVQVHGDPEQPTPAVSDHRMLRELPPEAVGAFVEVSGPGSGSPLLFSELRQFGGAIARPPQAPSAIGALTDPYCMFALGLAMDPDGAKAAAEHATKVCETMAPWVGERQYFNFAERPGSGADYYEADAYERLLEVRTKVDPEGMFQANHELD
ncbi:MAG: FAD-binding oxidoreductase [Solirubrobacterales bacterium]